MLAMRKKNGDKDMGIEERKPQLSGVIMISL